MSDEVDEVLDVLDVLRHRDGDGAGVVSSPRVRKGPFNRYVQVSRGLRLGERLGLAGSGIPWVIEGGG